MRKGFSSTDLLGMIAVIAIAAGMSTPALQRARAEARKVACINNLRQLGAAVALFQTDNQQRFPAQNNFCTPSLIGGCGCDTYEPNDMGGCFEDWSNSCKGTLWPEYVSDAMIVFCPNDSGETPPRPDTWRSWPAIYRHDKWQWGYQTFGGDPLMRIQRFSYFFSGEHMVQPEEMLQSDSMRLMADNEQEDDEFYYVDVGPGWWGETMIGTWDNAHEDYGYWTMANESSMFEVDNTKLTLCIQTPDDGADGDRWGASARYEYIGGLEKGDNHGTDGVNVLFADLHAAFDRAVERATGADDGTIKAWVDPIGWLTGWSPASADSPTGVDWKANGWPAYDWDYRCDVEGFAGAPTSTYEFDPGAAGDFDFYWKTEFAGTAGAE